MVEKIIEAETNRLAREKGFDIYTCRCGGFPDCICYGIEHSPTQSLLQKWLREKYDIDIDISRGGERNTWYMGYIKFGYGYIRDYMIYTSYEDALEAGLVAALKLI